MKVLIKKDISQLKPNETLVIYISEESGKNIQEYIPAPVIDVIQAIDVDVIDGKSDQVLYVPLKSSYNLLFVGIGKEDDVDLDVLRNSSLPVITQAQKNKDTAISLCLPKIKNLETREAVKATVEGIYIANYIFDKYKTDKNNKVSLLQKVAVISEEKGLKKLLEETALVCNNVLLCRDLVNETSEYSNPLNIVKEAQRIAEQNSMTCTVLGKKEITKLNMGLILAVSKGSPRPPQLVILEYKGDPASRKSVALVGKGVTFDSGGINLKPSGHIEDMRMDMAGAATVLYAIKSAAELKIKKNIYVLVPLVENLVSGDSYRPGDIFTSYSGKTVEIGNTDAEGRLILADTIAYCEKTIKPDYIIDVATLTGACLVTFGELVAAALTNSKGLRDLFIESSDITGEKVWELPVYKEFEKKLKSEIADLNNITSDRKAGTIIGGAFIKQFIEKSEWLHLDIAGTAWSSEVRGFLQKGATGYGVRLLLEVLKKI